MKPFLSDCIHIFGRVIVSPFEHAYLGEAWEGLMDIVAFVVIVLISLLVLATAPLSIPALAYVGRRRAAQREERMRKFRVRVGIE